MMNKLPYLLSIFIIIILDQLSKWYVLEEMLLNKAYAHKVPRDFITWMTEVKAAYLPPVSVNVLDGYVNFSMVWNRGVSFGLFQQSGAGVWGLVGVTGVIVLGLLVWFFKAENMNTRTSLVLIIGGALGNIIDRARFGSVIDFVDVYFGEWHYPAFNFADSCIVIGVLLMLLNSFTSEKSDKSYSLKKNK
jgi:signal peptidase II|tara:strand:+ start:144647 stop:145216 length:570 start_codon:yes stop_codon:yes gene_type:complete